MRILCSLCLLTALLSGCVTTPYSFGTADRKSRSDCDAQQIAVAHGRPYAFIDGMGWGFTIFDKILLWDRRAMNHHVGPETEQAATDYLAAQGLDDVLVRVNQYDPRGEWKRLVANDTMAPGWKYTAGTIRWIGYTVLPGRVFGRDYYNPFTNSLNLYSDIPQIAVREAAYARDIARRKYPGTYATFQSLSPISLWHDTIATNEALSYYAANGSVEEQQAAWKILPAQYGTILGNTVVVRVAHFPVSRIAGAIAGHGYGRFQASQLNESDFSKALDRDEEIAPVGHTTLDDDDTSR